MATDYGRSHAWEVTLYLDACGESYGAAPCAAALGTTGATQCYNTRATCQDATNYNRQPSGHVYKLVSRQGPAGLAHGRLPVVESVQITEPELDPEAGISKRASATITCRDFVTSDHPDSDAAPGDPYRGARPQGTPPVHFFRVFQARNFRALLGRPVQLQNTYSRQGAPVELADLRQFVITEVSGPDGAGCVTIKASDPLEALHDARLFPAYDDAHLTAAAGPADNELSLAFGTAPDPATGLHIEIGGELMRVANLTAALTQTVTVTRALFGTAAGSHAVDAPVKFVFATDGENAVDLTRRLLTERGGVPAGLIDSAGFDSERDTWLSLANVRAVFTRPEKLTKALGELAKQSGFFIYYDALANLIRLRAIRPPRETDAVFSVEDFAHIEHRSLTHTADLSRQATQVWAYRDRIDWLKDDSEPANYQALTVFANLEAEAPSYYGRTRADVMFGTWAGSYPDGELRAILARRLTLLVDGRQAVAFSLAAKDAALAAGQVCTITTAQITDAQGNPRPLQALVVSAENDGTTRRYTALLSGFGAVAGDTTRAAAADIGPDTLEVYLAESAANRAAYCFLSDAAGVMSDGSPGYRIV